MLYTFTILRSVMNTKAKFYAYDSIEFDKPQVLIRISFLILFRFF